MGKQATLLVVDDNPTNLSVLFEYLEESGFEVSVAKSGERALRQLKRFKPDLILLDIMMPGMDGFEVCQQLKDNKKTRDIPIIFMTALTDSVDKIKGFLAGGADYITKPLQHEEVLARISAHLKIRRLEQELKRQHTLLQRKQDIIKTQKTDLKAREENAMVQAYYERLLSFISYDLQHPLNKLIGFIRIITENIDDLGKGEIKGHIHRLQTSLEEFYASHENLLLWAQYHRGLLDFTPEQVDLYDLATYNIARFASQAEKKKITLSSSIQEGTLAYADYHMMDSVMRNLLSNALKFTEIEGSIHITTIEVEGTIEISISDTGIGMGKEQLASIFEAISVPSSSERNYPAITGLGLLLSKELILQNGGTIWCTSEIGKGTTFTFRLPKGDTQHKRKKGGEYVCHYNHC